MVSTDEHDISPEAKPPETGDVSTAATESPAASSPPAEDAPVSNAAPVEPVSPAPETPATETETETEAPASSEAAETSEPADATEPTEATEAAATVSAKPSVSKRRPPSKPVRWGRVFAIAAKVAGVTVAAALIAFIVGRWVIANDAERIQGTWRIDGAETAITITDKQIILSEDLTFEYALDPMAKTITFYFTDLEGSGHYRFSLDGDRLAIQDGAFNGWETFASDLPATVAELAQGVVGMASPLFGDAPNVTNLTRITEKNPTGAASYGDAEKSPEENEETAPIETLGEEPTSEAGTGAV